ncbi:MAG: glycosyltransferase family 2 protein [Candidatus Lutacidiplasmatales archaeon]
MRSGPDEPQPPPSRTGPFISVVVTAYRRRQYLLEAVRSIVATTLDPSVYEIVVVKDYADASIDSELSHLGPQVRLITIDLPRMGDSLARGIAEARGDVIAFLEDDDRFLPGKLEAVAERFRSDSHLGFLRHAYRAIDADGRPLSSWESFRPTPPAARDFDPTKDRAGDLPWVFRYAPNVNLSAMALRAEVVRPHMDDLRLVTAALDSFLFLAALVSERTLRVEPGPWSEYRVHASLSHSAIADGSEQRDLGDTARSLPTARVMAGVLARRPGHSLARRFTEAFRLEVEVNIFLLDPSARLSVGDWIRFLGSAASRRQKYLLVPWIFCLYRWLAPEVAVRAYRKRRTRTLRVAAAS